MTTKMNSTETIPVTASNRRGFVKGLGSAVAGFIGLAMVSRVSAFSSRKTFRASALRRGTSTGSAELNQQVPYVYWTWGEVRRGDCTIAPGATFYLYANGATRWVCDLRSSDSGDEWDGRFEIKNGNGQVLAATPGYHFDISQENVTTHWDESRGPNSSLAGAYPNASGISFFCSC